MHKYSAYLCDEQVRFMFALSNEDFYLMIYFLCVKFCFLYDKGSDYYIYGIALVISSQKI